MNPFEKHLERYREEGIDYLRANVPEVQRVESLEELQDLRLVRQSDLGSTLMLMYEAAAPSLFPAVRQRLIDRGFGRHHMVSGKREKRGTPEETCRVTMGFYGSMLQISLKVRK